MRHPAKITFLTLCRALPQIAVQFQRTIPDAFWTVTDATKNTVEVCCPCGESPTAPPMIPVACPCGRFFLYDGHDVRVARYLPDTAVAACD